MKKVLFLLLAFLWLHVPTQSGAAVTAPIVVNSDDNCNLSAPGTFTANRTSGTSADLSWSAVSGASAYSLTVYEAVGGTTSGSPVGGGRISGTSTTISYLESGKHYRCYLASVCSDGTSSIIIIDTVVE